MYVYINSEPGLWTVGFYKPDGKFEPESDHIGAQIAAERAAWLNGVKSDIEDYVPKKEQTKPDNPRAFPAMDMNSHYGVDRLELRHEGITLRDYFAAKAITAAGVDTSQLSTMDLEILSQNAYKIADAMLVERSKLK